MKVYAGSSNRKLGERIAKELGTTLLLPEKFVFPDGEERIRILEKVVGEDCVVVQPLSTPVNEHFVELLFIVDALKRSGAKSVALVVPYLGYQRQDHVFRDGEAVSLEVVIKSLEIVGADKIICFDLHSIRIPDLFHIPAIHLTALPIFADKVKELAGSSTANCILISPDMGGVARVKKLSDLLDGMHFAAIEKNRDLATGGVTATEIHDGDVKGKTAFIVDDMISSGGTIVKATELLKKEGVEKIYVLATHPVFSQNASALLQAIDVEKVFVTDTINISKYKKFPKLEILSVSKMVAQELRS